MNKRMVNRFATGTPQHVVADAMFRHKKGRNLALGFNGVKNPRTALILALDEQRRMGIEFGYRVSMAIKVSEYGNQGFKTLEMQIFGQGVLAARDNYGGGEVDVYFDPSLWELVVDWGSMCFPQLAKRFDLGVLPGVGQIPAVSSFNGALSFARRNLRPKEGVNVEYNPSPRQIALA